MTAEEILEFEHPAWGGHVLLCGDARHRRFVQFELIRNLADYWRLILGLFIIVFVLGVPQGIVGAFMNRFGKGER